MQTALERFADALQQKFSVHVKGEPEDQLRSPFEQLLIAVGKVTNLGVLAIGKTLLGNRAGKPDFGVSTNKLLCGKDLGRDFHFAADLLRTRLAPSAKIIPLHTTSGPH
jgi:hypothetical protein